MNEGRPVWNWRKRLQIVAVTAGLAFAAAGVAPVLPVYSAQQDAFADAAAADHFRYLFGLPTATDALSASAASETAKAKWGVDLTAEEEADLDSRARLQEELGKVDELVASNSASLGGFWLDQRASHGHGFVVMVGFVGAVNKDLLTQLEDAAPADVIVKAAVVERSAKELQELADRALEVGAKDSNVTGVSLATQDNSVLVRTLDGSIPAALDQPGYVVEQGWLTPVVCTSTIRCSLRPYRGGMEIQDEFRNPDGTKNWYECTSAFTVKRSNGAYSLLTAAHCQQDYVDPNVWTYVSSIGTIQSLGEWGSDTVPPHSIFCLTICDMDVETQLINNLVSLPTSKNIILYSGTDTAHAITSYRTWGSSWNGSSVCSVGVRSNVSCGLITSVGTGNIPMRKENYTARINKGAYADLAGNIVGGDSGGPVLNGGKAYGTMTAVTPNGIAFFSAVSPALSGLSVTLCTTSSC